MTINVSASALKDFLSCSRKVHYRIFEPGVSIPTREMLMGSITHKVLEKAWDDKTRAVGMIDTLCRKESIDEIGRNSVLHFVHTYFDKFSPLVTKDDKIEKRFKVKLWDDVYLVGVFDRISRGLVIDWKTDANPPKKIDNHVQFIIYNIAYEMVYEQEPVGIYLAALKDGSLVKYRESLLYKEVILNELIPDYVEVVRKRNFVREGIFNGACFRCPYKEPCLDGDNDVMVRGNFATE